MQAKCPFCGEPAVRTMAGGMIAFRCGTDGPYVDSNGEATYSTGRVCDMHTYHRLLREKDAEIERLTRELAVVNAQSEWRLKNAENTRRWADFVVERLREALAACRKYADARLTDDPNDGLALVIEKVVSGRMGPLRDQAEGGE